MAPDEIMVYSSMALVPAFSGFIGWLALLAVRRKILSVLVSWVLFCAAVIVGMLLSFVVVNVFSHLLHGDAALAIIAAPITGALLTCPVALIFAIFMAVIKSQLRT